MSCLPAVVGDALCLDGCRYVVKLACDRHSRACACIGCAQLLANELQVEFHLERAGVHVLARMCAIHGAEELPPWWRA